MVKYKYDAWGNHKVLNPDGTENTAATFIGNVNPFRYRSYYYDTNSGLYYLQTRFYDPETGRFLNADTIDYLEPDTINGLNLYAYCRNNPVMMTDETGHMPKWARWVVGGLAIAGLVVATVLTFGAAGAAAVPVGMAMLAGGVVSATINITDQLHDNGTVDWTEVAISTLSGTAYGLVVGLSGGVAAGTWSWGVYAGKMAVAAGTSLLNSWNENKSFKDTMISLASSLVASSIIQGLGYAIGGHISMPPKNSASWFSLGDIASCLWSTPAVKTGVIRFVSGVANSLYNDIF